MGSMAARRPSGRLRLGCNAVAARRSLARQVVAGCSLFAELRAASLTVGQATGPVARPSFTERNDSNGSPSQFRFAGLISERMGLDPRTFGFSVVRTRA